MTAEYRDRLVIGVDVGGTGLKGAVIDRQGNVFVKETSMESPTIN